MIRLTGYLTKFRRIQQATRRGVHVSTYLGVRPCQVLRFPRLESQTSRANTPMCCGWQNSGPVSHYPFCFCLRFARVPIPGFLMPFLAHLNGGGTYPSMLPPVSSGRGFIHMVDESGGQAPLPYTVFIYMETLHKPP